MPGTTLFQRKGLDWLEEHWNEAWDAILPNGEVAARDSGFCSVFTAYTSKGRAYHSLAHLFYGFRLMEEVLPKLQPEEAFGHPGKLYFAYFLHDYVYRLGPNKEPADKTDEELSAEYAIDLLAAGGASPFVQSELYEAILATSHAAEFPPTSRLEKVLVDIDLAILGADEEQYDHFEWAIRQEYSWVPQAAYQAGRTRVLSGILKNREGRPFYNTKYLEGSRGPQARANLARAIAALQLQS